MPTHVHQKTPKYRFVLKCEMKIHVKTVLVHFTPHVNALFGPLELFEHLKRINKFGIVGKPRLSRVLQWEIF